jgi:tRNA-dihydrouridine synthase
VPDYELARELAEELDPVPLIVSGGLRSAATVREAFERTGAAAVMLARGSLGNPWLFEQLLGRRATPPSRDEVLGELDWVIEQAARHFGAHRAARYLRKFYPWYVDRLGEDRQVQEALQRTESIKDARAVLRRLLLAPAA